MPKKEKISMGLSYPDGSTVMSGDMLKVEGIFVPVAARAYASTKGGNTIKMYTYWDKGPRSLGARAVKKAGFDRWENQFNMRPEPAPVPKGPAKGPCIIAQLDYDHVEVVNI